MVPLLLSSLFAYWPPEANGQGVLARVNLADRKISDEDPNWVLSGDTESREVADDFEDVEDDMDEMDEGDELVAMPEDIKKKAGKTSQQLEVRMTRVPPTMIYAEPTEAELKKKDPKCHYAVAGKYSPITLPKFWKEDTSTPQRKLFLEIRYKDVAPKLAEVYVYNGRTFLGNRRGHTKGYRRLGVIGGVDDGRWKTAIFDTSPFDFRYEKKWNGTQVLIRSKGKTKKEDDQQDQRDLPVEYVAVREPTQELEIAARKLWRHMLHIRTDVDRRERSELRWEDQTKEGSDQPINAPDKPEPYPTKYDKLGFIPYRVDLYEDVAPIPDPKSYEAPHISAPKRKHVKETIETFMTLGEYEPATFAVYPLRDLANLRYEVSDLKMDDGVPFTGWVKPGYVEYTQFVFVPRTEEETQPRGLWRNIPLRLWELNPYDSFDLRKGVPLRFWLTIRADADCSPGLYRGTVTVTSDASEPLEMPLKVQVLPIQVPSTSELGKIAGHTMSPRISEQEYWLMREHNFNMVHEFWNCGINAHLTPKTIDLTYGAINDKMQFAKKIGFTTFIIEMANVRKILDGGYPDCLHADQFADWTELYSRGCFLMREHAKANNWPELGFCPSDEPWGFFMWHMNEVVRRWMKKYDPETPVYANMYGGHHTHVMKNFDIINSNATGGDPMMAYECKQYGIDLWIYGGHREKFGPWVMDVDGILKYRYNTGHNLFYRGVSDGEPKLYFHRGEPLPKLGYERRRDGLDGCRYAWHLLKLLKEKPNPELERKMLDLKYTIKAAYYNKPGWREKHPNPGTLDLGRNKLMAKCDGILDSWKGKDEKDPEKLSVAGEWCKLEKGIHQRSMGKPIPDLSYNTVRRQLTDWILEVSE